MFEVPNLIGIAEHARNTANRVSRIVDENPIVLWLCNSICIINLRDVILKFTPKNPTGCCNAGFCVWLGKEHLVDFSSGPPQKRQVQIKILEPGEEGSQTASDHERVVRIFGNNAGNVQNARTEVEYVEEVPEKGKSTWDDGTTWRVAGNGYVKKEVPNKDRKVPFV